MEEGAVEVEPLGIPPARRAHAVADEVDQLALLRGVQITEVSISFIFFINSFIIIIDPLTLIRLHFIDFQQSLPQLLNLENVKFLSRLRHLWNL